MSVELKLTIPFFNEGGHGKLSKETTMLNIIWRSSIELYTFFYKEYLSFFFLYLKYIMRLIESTIASVMICINHMIGILQN